MSKCYCGKTTRAKWKYCPYCGLHLGYDLARELKKSRKGKRAKR